MEFSLEFTREEFTSESSLRLSSCGRGWLQGKFDAARADYEKAMELDPNDMSLVQGMRALNVGADSTEAKAKGDEAFKAGRYDEAASCYSTAIQVDTARPTLAARTPVVPCIFL